MSLLPSRAGIAFDEYSHVCAHEDGTPDRPRAFTGRFQHIIRAEAGLPWIKLNNLRHSSVSVMLRAGIPASAAAWHCRDVRMTTAVCNRVYDEGLTASASGCSHPQMRPVGGALTGRWRTAGPLNPETDQTRRQHRV